MFLMKRPTFSSPPPHSLHISAEVPDLPCIQEGENSVKGCSRHLSDQEGPAGLERGERLEGKRGTGGLCHSAPQPVGSSKAPSCLLSFDPPPLGWNCVFVLLVNDRAADMLLKTRCASKSAQVTLCVCVCFNINACPGYFDMGYLSGLERSLPPLSHSIRVHSCPTGNFSCFSLVFFKLAVLWMAAGTVVVVGRPGFSCLHGSRFP